MNSRQTHYILRSFNSNPIPKSLIRTCCNYPYGNINNIWGAKKTQRNKKGQPAKGNKCVGANLSRHIITSLWEHWFTSRHRPLYITPNPKFWTHSSPSRMTWPTETCMSPCHILHRSLQMSWAVALHNFCGLTLRIVQFKSSLCIPSFRLV